MLAKFATAIMRNNILGGIVMSIKTMETMGIVFMWMTMVAIVGCMLGLMGLKTMAIICIAIGFISMVISIILGIKIYKYYKTH